MVVSAAINSLIDRVAITGLTYNGTTNLIDVSGYVPTGATAVLISVLTESTTLRTIKVFGGNALEGANFAATEIRADRDLLQGTSPNNNGGYYQAICPLNSSGEIYYNIPAAASSEVKLYIEAWFDDSWTWDEDYTLLTGGAEASFGDQDLGASGDNVLDGNDGTVVAVVLKSWGKNTLRPNGSSHDAGIDSLKCSYHIVSVDANDIFEVNHLVTGKGFGALEFVGYITAGITMKSAEVQLAVTTSGSFHTKDLTSDTDPNARIILLQIEHTGTDRLGYARHPNSSNPFAFANWDITYGPMIIGTNSDQEIEVYQEATNVNWWILGHVEVATFLLTGSGTLTISGNADITLPEVDFEHIASGGVVISGGAGIGLTRIASGGIRILGYADVEIAFVHIATGGLQTSGAAIYNTPFLVFFTSGSLYSSGTAPYSTDYDHSGTGTITVSGTVGIIIDAPTGGTATLSGSADLVKDFNYSGTGSIITSGEAVRPEIWMYGGAIYVISYTRSVSGTATLSGAADYVTDFNYTGTGSANLSGSSDLESNFSYESTGGLVTYGESPYTYPGLVFHPSGRIRILGQPPIYTLHFANPGTGSVILSGSIDHEVIFKIIPAGNIILSGAADTVIVFPATVTGNITISGSADIILPYEDIQSTGILTISGTAPYTIHYAHTATGSIVSDGEGAKIISFQYVGSGSISTEFIIPDTYIVGFSTIQNTPETDASYSTASTSGDQYGYLGTGTIQFGGSAIPVRDDVLFFSNLSGLYEFEADFVMPRVSFGNTESLNYRAIVSKDQRGKRKQASSLDVINMTFHNVTNSVIFIAFFDAYYGKAIKIQWRGVDYYMFLEEYSLINNACDVDINITGIVYNTIVRFNEECAV